MNAARNSTRRSATGHYDIVPYQTTHNTGGAIMGADPKTSVVNKYLQSWDVPNLFVMGACAFPQNAGYNPTGTVAALAYWAADGHQKPVSEKPRTVGADVTKAMRNVLTILLAVVVVSCISGLLARAADASFATIERGHHLVDAGDCVACHTDAKGRRFAGDRPIETPFGTIYSPNITPDRETGIGAWSDEQFYRAMHEGIRPDGSRLYPAFPYTYFTKMTRDDVLAIRAYLNTLPDGESGRVSQNSPGRSITVSVMRGWDLMFFTPGTFGQIRTKARNGIAAPIW